MTINKSIAYKQMEHNGLTCGGGINAFMYGGIGARGGYDIFMLFSLFALLLCSFLCLLS